MVVVIGYASVVVGIGVLVGGLCRGMESPLCSGCEGGEGKTVAIIDESRLKEKSFSDFCFKVV